MLSHVGTYLGQQLVIAIDPKPVLWNILTSFCQIQASRAELLVGHMSLVTGREYVTNSCRRNATCGNDGTQPDSTCAPTELTHVAHALPTELHAYYHS